MPRRSMDASSPINTTPLLEEDHSSDPAVENSNRNGSPVATAYPDSNGVGQQVPLLQRTCSLMMSPLIDESGGSWQVLLGLSTLLTIGSLLGWWMPKNTALPTEWYRTVSSCMGYTYFLCWSVSFYPQVMTNIKRKSTQGLSVDFCGLNVLGFLGYSIYNIALYTSPSIQHLYRQRHSGGDDSAIPVQSNDVAFAVHALILALITWIQIAYYGGGWRALKPSKVIFYFQLAIVVACLSLALVVASGGFGIWNWLDYLYWLSSIKILISIVKYMPQVWLNYSRQSTEGWNVWNILLDFTGGLLSDLQLILDCKDLGDWTGITGNLAKLGLGMVSILFDIIFVVQHYVLYATPAADASNSAHSVSQERLLHRDDENDGEDLERAGESGN